MYKHTHTHTLTHSHTRTHTHTHTHNDLWDKSNFKKPGMLARPACTWLKNSSSMILTGMIGLPLGHLFVNVL